MDGLSRRAFVAGAAGLGLAAGCGRLPWEAQPPPKVPPLQRIGVLSFSTPQDVTVLSPCGSEGSETALRGNAPPSLIPAARGG
jgi:hypothetical protein